MLNKVIYIGGVARSGTSWIGQIFNSIPNTKFRFQPMFSYEFRDRINEDSTTLEYEKFFDDLFNSNTPFLTQRDKIDKGLYPAFKKNNESVLVFKENRFQSYIDPMLRKNENLVFIGVIRNPCATIFSWSQNEKEFPRNSNIMEEWRFANCKNKGNEDYFGYYKWKEVANLYLDLKLKYKERVQIIHYDSFVNNVKTETECLFSKIGLDFDQQTLNFIEQSQKGEDSNYYSVYKSEISRNIWKYELPKYIIDEIIFDLNGTRLQTFLKD